jgi:hypothetical protein
MTALVVEELKSVFAESNRMAPDKLSAIYHRDIVFTDPVHTLEGLGTLTDYFTRMYSNVTSCRFEYTDEMILDNRGSLRWVMHLKHPKLAGGEEVEVPGASFLQFGDQITHHEDYYDLGAMLYENIAVLGSAIRHVKKRLS